MSVATRKNVIEQLKNGVNAMRMPVDDLLDQELSAVALAVLDELLYMPEWLMEDREQER
jgi:hypothetical protein